MGSQVYCNQGRRKLDESRGDKFVVVVFLSQRSKGVGRVQGATVGSHYSGTHSQYNEHLVK